MTAQGMYYLIRALVTLIAIPFHEAGHALAAWLLGDPTAKREGRISLNPFRHFASAGTDFDGKNAANKDLFGGGSGAGVNIQPVAFLVVKDGCVRTIQLSDGNNTVDRALTAASRMTKMTRSYRMI